METILYYLFKYVNFEGVFHLTVCSGECCCCQYEKNFSVIILNSYCRVARSTSTRLWTLTFLDILASFRERYFENHHFSSYRLLREQVFRIFWGITKMHQLTSELNFRMVLRIWRQGNVLWFLFYICGSINDVASGLDCVASCDRVISEWRIGYDVEGNGCGFIWGMKWMYLHSLSKWYIRTWITIWFIYFKQNRNEIRYWNTERNIVRTDRQVVGMWRVSASVVVWYLMVCFRHAAFRKARLRYCDAEHRL